MSDKKSYRGPSKAERAEAADRWVLDRAIIRGDKETVEKERARLAQKKTE